MKTSAMNVPIGFDLDIHVVALDALLPSKKISHGAMQSRKYIQIKSSIGEVGLIEPLSVVQPDSSREEYLLLDGHMRALALRELKMTEAPCLLSTDDETYTYNNRINRLSTIQEHYMLRCAIERGVSKERLARAFNLNLSAIDRQVSLLDGVAPEAIVLLRDQRFAPQVARILRRMVPERQVECVELMLAASTVTGRYAKALLYATPADQLANKKPLKPLPAVTREEIARMEQELGKVKTRYQQAEKTYGEDLLNLVVAKGYLSRILANGAVKRYLSTHQPEVLQEFQRLVDTVALEPGPKPVQNDLLDAEVLSDAG